MSERDYAEIAKIVNAALWCSYLGTSLDKCFQHLISELANFFAQGNPNFDYERWRAACYKGLNDSRDA